MAHYSIPAKRAHTPRVELSALSGRRNPGQETGVPEPSLSVIHRFTSR
jgi:hypothetical protein